MRKRGGALPEACMDQLALKVADISAEGLSLSWELTAEELGLTDADLSLRGTLAVGLDLRAVERTICVTGVIEGTAVRQCVRCLKDFEDPLAFSIHVAYEREARAPASLKKHEKSWKRRPTSVLENVSDEPNDDLYRYSGDHLELAPMLREQLILASPMHPLCQESCLGLCPHCGKNLNEGPCQCVGEPTGGPFHVLHSVKDKIQEA